MVCKKCEKFLTKASAPDPFRNRNAANSLVTSGSGAGPSRGVGAPPVGGGRKVGENKLLSKSNRFSPLGRKCKLCKQNVTQEHANYCQGCAYKRGLCAICGKQILDTSSLPMLKVPRMRFEYLASMLHSSLYPHIIIPWIPLEVLARAAQAQ